MAKRMAPETAPKTLVQSTEKRRSPTASRAADMLGRSGVQYAEWAERVALPALWAVVTLFFVVLPATGSRFATLANFGSIFGAGAVTVVLTIGLIIPAIAGDYDLSVAYNLTLSSIVVAALNVNHHVGIVFSVLVAMGVGLVVGAVNALVAVMFNVDPFIATLGTGTVLGGITLWLSNSSTISGVSPGLSNIVVVDRFLGIPLEFYFALALAVVLAFVLSYFPVGRRLRYVGQQREVARLNGVAVRRVRAGAFVVTGVLSAAAGVLYAGNAGAADPSSGTTLLLPAFAAAFLGATTITPGQFNPIGSVVAVYFLGTGITGLEMLGASSYVQDLFYGGALVIAVIVSGVVRRQRGRRKATG